MLVGSAPSELKLGTTTVTGVRRGAGLIYDSDVAAFQKDSGATQVGPILALVDYLKAESLWDYARFYPMKSAQNAGSGSTVYGLGGLTSNNMTLVNSPTWGSDGVTFDGSTQYGQSDTGDLSVYDEAAVFLRAAPTLASAADSGYAIRCCVGNYRSATPAGTSGYALGGATGLLGGETIAIVYTVTSDTSDGGRRLGSSLYSWAAEEDYTAVYQTGDLNAIWKNKTSVAIDRQAAVTTTSSLGPSDLGSSIDGLVVGGQRNNGTIVATTGAGDVSLVLLYAGNAALTTTQREAITDLINAL